MSTVLTVRILAHFVVKTSFWSIVRKRTLCQPSGLRECSLTLCDEDPMSLDGL